MFVFALVKRGVAVVSCRDDTVALFSRRCSPLLGRQQFGKSYSNRRLPQKQLLHPIATSIQLTQTMTSGKRLSPASSIQYLIVQLEIVSAIE